MSDPILDKLAQMRSRPPLYIGKYSAEALFTYLAGYVGALLDHTDLNLTQYEQFIEGLYARYGYGGGGHSWAWVLGQSAGGDAAGLDLFFAELEAFQQRQGETPSISSPG